VIGERWPWLEAGKPWPETRFVPSEEFEAKVAEFVERKRDPKWKAPKLPVRRGLRPLSPAARARLEKEWALAAK
jgi:hypothetical protein